ncbi:MAG: hypothetical protein KY443_06795 [Actinobacteria bacterium]|nr:hypothetical protein [Actinomycetota bacterium]
MPLLRGSEHFECTSATRLTWDLVTDRELWLSELRHHPFLVATGCG